ncbi:hypothetical protein ACFFT9_22795, partial [Chromobacterium violaceum]
MASTILKVGDKFTLKTDESDLDENGQERITPALSVWEVVELEPECDPVMQYSVVCHQTGAWIHITHTELAACGYQLVSDVRSLICCCCGGRTMGRQWFNQDVGYGLGKCCVDYCAKGAVAQILNRARLPFPQINLRHSHRTRTAQHA